MTRPREAQAIAYEKGLIPYIPADQRKSRATLSVCRMSLNTRILFSGNTTKYPDSLTNIGSYGDLLSVLFSSCRSYAVPSDWV